jgi:hypothetical protein
VFGNAEQQAWRPSMSGLLSDEALHDKLEQSFWLDVARSPVLDAVEEGLVEVRRYGRVQAVTAAAFPRTPMFNLVLGAGDRRAVVDGGLEEALDWVESREVDFRVPLTPELEESPAAEDLLNRRGYRHGANLLRFVREAGPPDFGLPPGIEVVELDEFSGQFSDLAVSGFGCDLMATAFFDCLPGREAWRCYLARDERGAEIAAAATMFHYGAAQLNFAVTASGARRQGAQLALLHRRLLDASGPLCETLVAEVEQSLEEAGGAPPPAARNLIRAGFEQVAVRPVWRPPAPPAPMSEI